MTMRNFALAAVSFLLPLCTEAQWGAVKIAPQHSCGNHFHGGEACEHCATCQILPSDHPLQNVGDKHIEDDEDSEVSPRVAIALKGLKKKEDFAEDWAGKFGKYRCDTETMLEYLDHVDEHMTQQLQYKEQVKKMTGRRQRRVYKRAIDKNIHTLKRFRRDASKKIMSRERVEKTLFPFGDLEPSL